MCDGTARPFEPLAGVIDIPHDRHAPRGPPTLPPGPRGLLARAEPRHHVGHPAHARPRCCARAVLPLVPGRRAEHGLQLPRPARGGWARRAAGADLRQPRHGHAAHAHLPRAARRGGAVRGGAAGQRCDARRPRDPVHAHDPRGGGGHAGVRAPRRRALGGVRGLRRRGAGHAHRRREARADGVRVVRHRAFAHGGLQAAARRGHRAGVAQAGALHREAAPAAAGHASAGARRELGRRHRGSGCDARGVRAGERHRPALHPLHVGDHGAAQGRGARPGWPRGGAAVLHAGGLWRAAGRGVLGGVRRGLGGGPQLHRLRATPEREHYRCCSRASRWARPTRAPSSA